MKYISLWTSRREMKGSSMPREITVHQCQQRCPTGRHARLPLRPSSSYMLRCSTRFEDDHAKIGKRSQRPVDAPSDFLPRKTAETGTERRYGDRTQIETTNLCNECLEARLDVFHSRAASPVTLGGEVDDVAWRSKLASLEYEHPPGLDVTVATRRSIGARVFRPRLLELLCDPGAHVPDAVDRVDERIGLLRQQILRSCTRSSSFPDGQSYQSARISTAGRRTTVFVNRSAPRQFETPDKCPV